MEIEWNVIPNVHELVGLGIIVVQVSFYILAIVAIIKYLRS